MILLNLIQNIHIELLNPGITIKEKKPGDNLQAF